MANRYLLKAGKKKDWGYVYNIIEVSSFQEAMGIIDKKTDGFELYDSVVIYNPEPKYKYLTRWVDTENVVWIFYEPIIKDLKELAYGMGIDDVHPDAFNVGINHYTNNAEFIEFLDKMAMAGLVNDFIPTPELIKKLNIVKPITLDLEQSEKGILEKNQIRFKTLYNRHKDKATEEMIKEILRKESIYTLKKDDKPEVWYYDGKKYVPEGKCMIEEYVRTFIGEKYKKKVSNDVIAKISVDTYIEADEFFQEPDDRYIPLINGIYDIQKRKLIPHSHIFRFRHTIPISYEPDANSDVVVNFLREILKNETDIIIMQEVFGNLLLRNYKHSKAVMYVADGSNGKSRLLELMRRFVGEENTSSVSLQAITNDKYIASELWGKLLNACGDISDTALKDTSIFKILLGNDKINANRKYKNPIQFVNYAKLAFSANQLPETNDLTTGFFRRWIIIEFPWTFYLPHIYDELPPNKKECAKVADPDILNKLLDPQQMSGLFNWALQGLERLELNKGFSESQSIEDLKISWLRKSNSVYAFVMDEIIEDYDSHIEKGDFRRAYNLYCKKHKVPIGTDSNIKYALKEVILEDKILKKGDTTTRAWMGIKFKHPHKYNSEPESDDLLTLDEYAI